MNFYSCFWNQNETSLMDFYWNLNASVFLEDFVVNFYCWNENETSFLSDISLCSRMNFVLPTSGTDLLLLLEYLPFLLLWFQSLL